MMKYSKIRPPCCLILAITFALLGCSGGSLLKPKEPLTKSQLVDQLHDTYWNFVEAQCIDRPLDLVSRGFEQRLRIRRRGDGLLLVEDNNFLSEGCVQTIMRFAQPAEEGSLWTIEEQARIALPAIESCRGREEELRTGVIKSFGNLLEITFYRSDYCNGFDARFAYLEVPSVPLTEHQLIRHYAGHFNRRDSESIADMFATNGVVLEPFSRTSDGNPKRYEGRDQIRNFYAGVFHSANWMALRLLRIENTEDTTLTVATWEYMDGNLAKPFIGTNRFVIASEQIFQTEFQTTSDIVAAPVKNRHPVLKSKSRGE